MMMRGENTSKIHLTSCKLPALACLFALLYLSSQITFAQILIPPRTNSIQTVTALNVQQLGDGGSSDGTSQGSRVPKFEELTGVLVIAGGGTLPKVAQERFLKLAGDSKAKLAIVPTAADDATLAGYKSAWEDCVVASRVTLHTRSREQANDPQFLQPLEEATAVWFDGGSQERLAEVYVGTKFEECLKSLLMRGGVIGGTSAGAAILSKVMIASGNPTPLLKTGFDLLPGAIVDQHFSQRDRKPRLLSAIDQNPLLFGLGIDEDTAVIIRGRDIDVVGKGKVTICLPQCANRTTRDIELGSGEKTDFVRWRRAAFGRTRPESSPVAPPETRVPKGSLVIVGGGGLTAEITAKFIELAGGPASTIVVLPTANPDPLPNPPRDGLFLERAGCQRVITLNARSADEVSSPEFLKTLKEAKGVWFGGGRQWRFVDAYEGTPAIAAFHDVLSRGGVIGGSSAGATIQGDLLVRGSPSGNLEMMAEGYEQGFAFLPGTAIDQHFTQRKRQRDLLSVMETYPLLLGIGLDETTAIIVREHTAQVMGKYQAHFYDARTKNENGQPVCTSLVAGKKFDLIARKEVTDQTDNP